MRKAPSKVVAGLTIILASVMARSATGEEGFSLEEIYYIHKGELKLVEEQSDEIMDTYVRLTSKGGKDLDAKRRMTLPKGGTLTAQPGVNILVKGSEGGETWLNYNDSVEVLENGLMRLDGEALSKGGGSLLTRFSGYYPDGTEYYLNASAEDSMETIYVFKGDVTVRHWSGKSLLVKKGQAARSTHSEVMFVDMFEPDMAKAKQWREEVDATRLSWLANLIRLPLKYPAVTGIVVGAGTAFVVQEVITNSDSELRIQVTVP